MENTSKGLGDEQQKQLLFLMLVQQHEQIAGMGLGKIPNPATNKTEKDLNSAKYAIDTLIMLQYFTKGNITGEMDEFLDQTLTRLKLDYAKAVAAGREKPRSGTGTETGESKQAGAGTGAKPGTADAANAGSNTGEGAKPESGDAAEAVAGDSAKSGTGDGSESGAGERAQSGASDGAESEAGEGEKSGTGKKTKTVGGERTKTGADNGT